MNDFLLEVGRLSPNDSVRNNSGDTYNLFDDVCLRDHGALSYVFHNQVSLRKLFVIGNAIPRKAAKSKIDNWLNGSEEAFDLTGLDWVKMFNGIFLLIFVDSRTKNLSLVTDLLGFYPLYFIQTSTQFCISNRMQILSQQVTTPPEINEAAIYTYLHNGHLMFDQSWYREISRCRPASVYNFHSGSVTPEIKHYWTWNQIPAKTKAGVAEQRNFAHLFQRSVLDMDYPEMAAIGLGLSGGLDSRWIAHTLSGYKYFTAHCFAMQGSYELKLSQKVAKALNIPHQFHELDKKNWLENRLESFWMADGCLHLGHLHEGNLHARLFQDVDIFYHGFYGGGIYAGHSEMNARINNKLAASHFVVRNNEYHCDDAYFNFNSIDPYIVFQRMRYQAAYSILLLSQFTKIAIPFYDPDWLICNYQIDDRDQAFSRFYLNTLGRQLDKSLLEIPWQRTGLAPKHVALNCFVQQYKLNSVGERIYNLFGKSRHFINYKYFDDEINHWIREFSSEIKHLGVPYSIRKREHKLRMLSLMVWLRMSQKNRPNVL
ncbi:MAG: hypothetical protein IPM34_02615 [Saprospiraceae bacterium]|nr:hypothetical protein [Saprospiraceae bacterium]